MGELCICYRTLLQHTTPSSCHHAGNEGHEGDEGHEEGYEAPRNEGCRRGGTDEGHEGNEGHEGHEEGHEAPCDEGSRGGGTNEGHESDEGHESHEEGHEGDEGHESYEGHEGNEEVNGWKCASLLLLSIGQVLCLEQWRGPSPRSPVHTLRALHLDHSSKKK